MTQTKTSFLSDDKGQRSSMRLMCLLSLATAIGLSVLYACGKAPDGFDLNLILYFLGAAIGGKTAQKGVEKWVK